MGDFTNKFTQKLKKVSGKFGDVAKAVKNKDFDQGLEAVKGIQDEVDQTVSDAGHVVRGAAIETLAQGKAATDNAVNATKKTVQKWTKKK